MPPTVQRHCGQVFTTSDCELHGPMVLKENINFEQNKKKMEEILVHKRFLKNRKMYSTSF